MKNYTVQFGAGNPLGFTGLNPTFLTFWNLATGTTNTPPSIAELVTGKTGLYTFAYGVTQPIAFLLDAATTSPGTTGRYVSGQIDPSNRSDEYGNTLIAYGLSLLATGVSLTASQVTLTSLGFTASNLSGLLGTTASLIGSNLSDPTTVFGFLKRAQEIGEGDQTYTKASGGLTLSDRTGATLLASKVISDNLTATTKT